MRKSARFEIKNGKLQDLSTQKDWERYLKKYGDGRLPVENRQTLLNRDEGSVYIITGRKTGGKFGTGDSAGGYIFHSYGGEPIGYVTLSGPGLRREVETVGATRTEYLYVTLV